MAENPIEQFKIDRKVELSLAGFDVSFTNSSLWMIIVVFGLSFFMIAGMRKKSTIPGRWQMMVESLYELVAGLVRDNIGKDGKPYFPLVFTLFTFIMGANIAGLLPVADPVGHPFTVTSHLAVTGALAIFVFGFVTMLGFVKNGFGYFKLFAPAGVPFVLLIPVALIELVSYFSRPISHSVRLFANMMAGHIMLKVIAGFVVSLGALGGLYSLSAVLPFAFNLFLMALELLVAFLQAYVFAALTCLYISDALHPSH